MAHLEPPRHHPKSSGCIGDPLKIATDLRAVEHRHRRWLAQGCATIRQRTTSLGPGDTERSTKRLSSGPKPSRLVAQAGQSRHHRPTIRGDPAVHGRG